MDVLHLLHFLVFAHAIPSYTPHYCQEAVNTVKEVSSCPITQQDRDNAAKEKDCEKYSHQQNCSKATDFVYHCVINENKSALIEVCAPKWFIQGFCTEFNVKGGRIQDHYFAECSKFNPPCLGRYISTDAYLYESCYALVERRQTSERSYLGNMTSTTIGSNSVTSINGDSNDSILNWLLPVVGSLLILVLVLLLIYWKKRQSKRQRNPNIEDRKGLQAVRKETSLELNSGDEAEETFHLNSLDETDLKGLEAVRKELSLELNTRDEAEEFFPLNQVGETEENDSCNEIPQDVISKCSYTDLAIINRGRSIISMHRKDSGTANQNKQSTKVFLESFENLDKYFVETNLYKTVKKAIEEDRFAILIGPPGYGKTNTAIHLMLDPSFADWTMRKIDRLSELASVDPKEKTFVLIDNIFDGYVYDKEVGKWRDCLVYQFYNLSKQRNVQLLITAKYDVMETVWKYMPSQLDVFDRRHVVDVKNAQLTDIEKLEIFDNQMSYAKEELQMATPVKNEKFRKEIVAAEGPIGFPLCAHLFACAEKNRRMGSNFFSHPMNHLRDLVKHEIDKDQTPKTKTLLLLLSLSGICPEFQTMNLVDETMCKQALEKFSTEYEEFDTTDLSTQAKKLIPTILMQRQPGSFCFKHQTISKAVRNYFFDEHFDMARKTFPIETFVDQDFSTVTEKQCSEICARLIREVVENGNVSKVFSCIALTESSFAHRFCLQLDAQFDKHGVSFIRQFFAATGTPSCEFKLPGTFWVSKNKCFHLAMLMTEMIRKKNIDTDLHFYASLFGDCCARDGSLLKHANNTILENVENAKDAVLKCITYDGNNIFHIVTMTAKSDLHSSRSLKKLYSDFQDRRPEMYSKANKREETPLNLAATIKSDSRVLSILTFLEFDETCTNTKDVDGHYPIHNTALTLKSSIYNALFELEMTVRLCLFIVYGTNSDHQAEAKSLLHNQRFKHFYAMLECKSEKQNEMASIIKQLFSEIKNEKTDTEEGDTELPNPNKRINNSLLSTIQISVSFLVNAKFEI